MKIPPLMCAPAKDRDLGRTSLWTGLLCLSISLVAACSGDGASVDQPGARVRLWEHALGRLERKEEPELNAPAPILAETFGELDRKMWFDAVDADNPQAENVGQLLVTRLDPGQDFVRLSGERGGIYTIVPVEPGQCLELSAHLRTNALEPEIEAGFLGGTLFVAELSRAGAPRDVFAEGLEAVALDRHELRPTTGTSDGWVRRSRVIRAGPETHGLLVVCLLSLPGSVVGGSVDFTDLTLTPVPDHLVLEDARVHATEERTLGVLPADAVGDWRDRCVVPIRLRGESRPSIALLPGEKLELAFVVPGGGPRLEFGLGVFVPALVDGWTGREGTLSVAVDGEQCFQESLSAPNSILKARWNDKSIDLTAFAGETVTLSCRVSGDLPLVLGAPVVRDAARRQAGPNVLLISIDTLRADHVSAYGYERETTPNLDALAARGLLATDCTAQAPYTLPSHVSLFSGQPPSVHGVQTPGSKIAPGRTPLLADRLAKEGLRTQAFTAGGFLNPVFGFDRGFDGYANVDPYRDDSSQHIATLLAADPDNFDPELFQEYGPQRVLDWVDQHADERWMLFLHTYTVHDFDPPPGWAQRFELDVKPTLEDFQPYFDYKYCQEHGIPEGDRQNLIRYYDAALAYVDQELGRLFAKLDELGLMDQTVIIVTSDHGKEIGERGTVTHGVTLYEELTRVPLIIYAPGKKPRVLDTPVMSIDVTPTVLSLLGLDRDPRMLGLDLFGEVPSRGIWSEVSQPPLSQRFALREADGTKLLYDPEEFEELFPAPQTWELYHLGQDPGELDNLVTEPLSDDARAQFEEIRARLLAERAHLAQAGAALGAAAEGTIDASTREQLQALGYLGHEE